LEKDVLARHCGALISECTAPVNQADHQTNTASAGQTAVNGQHHFFKAELVQKGLNKRQKEGFLSYTWVDNQPFEAFFSAGNFDILRHMVRNLRQLSFFTDDDAGNHGRQGIQVSVEKAPRLSRV
jgi:hypothetical protein